MHLRPVAGELHHGIAEPAQHQIAAERSLHQRVVPLGLEPLKFAPDRRLDPLQER